VEREFRCQVNHRKERENHDRHLDHAGWLRAARAARLPAELLRHLHVPGSPLADDPHDLGWVRGWTAGAALGANLAVSDLVADEWTEADRRRPARMVKAEPCACVDES
jgi:hypothetical protein